MTTHPTSRPHELLKSEFSKDQLRFDEESLLFYGRDWTRFKTPKPLAIFFPFSTEDVQKIVQLSIQNKWSLVPSGGRTGLSGGALACNGEIVVSFEKMNRILEFREADRTVLCQSGVITEEIQNYVSEKGYFYPVDFAARGSSHIGGNVATNAGGIKVLRYGLTRDWIRGLKVVTGKGEILSFNNGLIKNATGYDLRQLFIGSEGTLGFITEVEVGFTNPPPPLGLFLVQLPSHKNIMDIFLRFKKTLTLTAFEIFSEVALQKVLAKNPALKRPFDEESPFYAVIEFEMPSEAQLDTALETFGEAMTAGEATNGGLSQNDQQFKEFWAYRERISESLASDTPYKNDISVRISKVTDFMQAADQALAQRAKDLEIIWFGHLGDGNLHINILKPQNISAEDFYKDCQQFDQILYSVVKQFEGSISAEHGVGLTKKPFLQYSKSTEEIKIFKEIKAIFDPHNIINPNKLFSLE